MRDGFPIIQAGLLARLDDEGYDDASALPVIDIGGMKNLDRKAAFGATFSIAADGDFTRLALKPRVRRWLSQTIAIDAAPGLALVDDSDAHGTDFLFPGFVGELSLRLGDWVTLTGQMEAIPVERPVGLAWPGFYTAVRTRETEVRWYAGAKLGGAPAIPVLFLAVLAMATLLDSPTVIY